ncbi:putative protein OS=Tsukamurella paurometabola (strain ATCC 8368 / DSM / CCUG 35730 /CIP 100753 / JCM 10117 / KCTC 9821 / NBRC 16120 / NCIMB 702349/ NCTC 13040) OX=521096 GN=Tpau_1288 PE=4 SV=1 [Tsukamurella paurometabola]|uniref:Uncharacterized protein n=1 Tax=Tsukamurella paurometabola (strain ATCC 8368 / DSM 20162 / CCUG 35730 / CIP 100753 / JCM 10117 / KCTC 9821 / NBRC 16120 / NCIMB 702349 / NCTC 13040) TaxID=521096 RepID=D5UWP6_TSUPD|nr:DUF2017 domain-containing protein [Tsukamurella paurometabola]ADG77918.1 Domain of unknown function DUF2017 [Tsukamurella paurometabola DSM 20162]SUP29349.1 Domain of uncharacterised function (DUF2017) [Tsukamurella paurometabola]
MRNWQAKRGVRGDVRFVSKMEPEEVGLVRSLVGSLIELLDEREDCAPHDELAELTGLRTGHSEPPDEGVLRRLLPDFYRPGADAPGAVDAPSGEFAHDLNAALRSLNEPEVIDAKRAAAQTVLATLPDRAGTVTLTEAEAQDWLTCINDLRLALGALLGITADLPDGPSSEDPAKAGHVDVYHWLSALLDVLVSVMLDREPE